MSETPKRHQFYGRRKGHALRRHHLQLVDELLPTLRADLSDPLKGVAEPRWLEIGFGGGEHLAHQASLHPEVCFIGAEPFVNGVAKLLALIEDKQLSNIRIHDGDARELLETLPDEAESEAEAAWDREIARRVEQVKSGTARLFSAEDVHAEARRLHG